MMKMRMMTARRTTRVQYKRLRRSTVTLMRRRKKIRRRDSENNLKLPDTDIDRQNLRKMVLPTDTIKKG